MPVPAVRGGGAARSGGVERRERGEVLRRVAVDGIARRGHDRGADAGVEDALQQSGSLGTRQRRHGRGGHRGARDSPADPPSVPRSHTRCPSPKPYCPSPCVATLVTLRQLPERSHRPGRRILIGPMCSGRGCMPFTISHALAVLPVLRQDRSGTVRGRGPLVAAALVMRLLRPRRALLRRLAGAGPVRLRAVHPRAARRRPRGPAHRRRTGGRLDGAARPAGGPAARAPAGGDRGPGGCRRPGAALGPLGRGLLAVGRGRGDHPRGLGRLHPPRAVGCAPAARARPRGARHGRAQVRPVRELGHGAGRAGLVRGARPEGRVRSGRKASLPRAPALPPDPAARPGRPRRHHGRRGRRTRGAVVRGDRRRRRDDPGRTLRRRSGTRPGRRDLQPARCTSRTAPPAATAG